MKPLPLVISLFFIVIIAAINVSLLYDNYSDYGVSKFFSLVISTVGIIPAVVLLCFPSGIKWITITKVLVLVAMATPAMAEEYRNYHWISLREFYFYLNLILIPLCIASMIFIHRNGRHNPTGKWRSSNS